MDFFYPTRFVVVVCFSHSLAGLLNWPFLNYIFLNPLSMYTTRTKLSFSWINTEAFILILQCATLSCTSKLGNVAKVFFAIRSQIVPLKLSFAFWVLPCKHFSNSVSLLSSKNIYRPYFINNVFWKTWPRFISLGVYKLALSALHLHQLSELMGQCG